MDDPLIHRRVLGRYRVVRSLAVGGMGIIYLGRSEGAAGFAKPVVIKRVIPDFAAADSNALEFFIREATILAQLRDPSIVSVLDFGEDEGAYTMVLEYVHGFHLGQWLRYHQRVDLDFPCDLAIHIVCIVLDALHHAHNLEQPDGTTMRVVHRDVTPSNVLIDIDGHVKLADFGIARISHDDDEKTQSGLLRGKMAYIAPELLHGQAASIASDVYSAGVMLHELVQGRNDFRSDIPAETVRLVLHAEPTPLEVVRRDVPKGLDDVLKRALAKDPKQRYASAREFREALRTVLPTSSDELQRKLDEATRADFAYKLPDALNIEPLADRDAAWRNAPTSVPPPSSSRSSSSGAPVYVNAGIPPQHDGLTAPLEDPTRAYPTGSKRHLVGHDGDTEVQPVPSPSRKPLYMGLAVAAFALLASGSIGAYFYAKRPAPRARFIVIDNTADESGEAAADAPAPPPVAAVAAPTPLDAGAPRADAPADTARVATASRSTSAPTQSTAERLTHAFAPRSGAVRACFERHTVGVAGAPAVQIRFHVGTTGEVTQANLVPSSIEGTDLGRCILGVARGARFGALDQPVAFSIPFTASRVQR